MQAELDISKIDIPNYIIEIGVISGMSKQRKNNPKGVTNADLMYIHENGSPLHHIPSRPVLKMSLAWAKKSDIIIRAVSKSAGMLAATGKVEDVDAEMDKMCVKIQNYARQIIYSNDGRLAPNSELTIKGGFAGWVKSAHSKYTKGKAAGKVPLIVKGKGVNHPLFDTGQLARSIVCRAIRVDDTTQKEETNART